MDGQQPAVALEHLIRVQMLVEGQLVPGQERMDVINPATEAVIGTAPRCSRDELDRVMASARAAYPAWRDTPEAERRAQVAQIAARVEAHAEEIAQILTAEQGKPLGSARAELMSLTRFLKGQAELEIPVVTNEDTPERLSRTYRVPIGVVAAISPWNYPVLLSWWKIIPALLAGNTVVLKPAPTTPLAALRIGELVADLFPAGVLSVVSGGDELGPWLTAHPEVDKISFTGSTATGRRVMEGAGATLKRLTLELGGNDPAVIFDDVDVEEMAQKLFMAAFTNAGQICIAAKRVYIQRAIYAPLTQALTRLVAAAKVGNGADPDTRVGPIQNRAQHGRVLELLADCKAQGYALLHEGTVPEGPGFFVPLTLVDNPPDDARIVQEEQFGPVLPLLVFDTEEEVIARANATDYGLAATVWTRDEDRALRVSHRLEAGTVWINEAIYLSPDAAFGGRKQSGLGAEHGGEGVLAVTEPQTISLRRG